MARCISQRQLEMKLQHIASIAWLTMTLATAGCSGTESGQTPASAQAPAAASSPAPTPVAPPPGEIAAKWQTDFAAFVSQVEKLRKSQNLSSDLPSDSGRPYDNKRVRWVLSFKALMTEPGKTSVELDLEPHGIKKQVFSGSRLIMIGVTADSASVAKWQAIKPGSIVTVEAISDSVRLVKMTPPGGSPKVVAVASLRDALPAKIEEVDDRLSGDWRFVMSGREWTVRLRPRPGLNGEFIGTARRTERDDKGAAVTQELGAALERGKIKAWLGQFVLCEAPFSSGQPTIGSCQALIGTLMGDGSFRAEKR